MHQNKTFAIKTPRDFLDKLEWDFEQLKQIPVARHEELTYQAMNCAITAWHMADWVLAFLPKERLAVVLGDTAGTRDAGRKFRAHLQKNCQALALCREVADAAKHQTIENNPDPHIATEHLKFLVEDTDRELTFWYLDDGEKLRDPKAMIDDAIFFWYQFLSDHGLLVRSHGTGQEVQRGHS